MIVNLSIDELETIYHALFPDFHDDLRLVTKKHALQAKICKIIRDPDLHEAELIP